ncbi:hypothetical protein [Zophobihabitans entericus]|uniref:Uncharacterized protein n=1 Tax=Zophobihabitans entericus TaxID=1635327 RepID=A0A6G9I8S2_9GAMM|nr:hypothetical protein [Zophobihabitans entericus]QIQ20239.1 hypothetical protein IPMB12_00210 [Zophobihabitans entericus]
MRKIIVTDLTRFSTDEKVCIAAIDISTGECFRPMPYIKSAKCKALKIHPGAIFVGVLDFKKPKEAPHVEDASYSKLGFSRACSSEEFRMVLENSLTNSISKGFGFTFEKGQKHIPSNQKVHCSIITIKINPKQLSIFEDQFKAGKIKATLIDNDGQVFSYLPITDRGFHDYAKKHQDNGKLNEITEFISNQEIIYLRIGLSRAYQSPNGKSGYWLQINGIYTYPNFHEEIRAYD